MSSKKINARIQKWRMMISEGVFGDPILLRSRIRKGIPTAMRSIAWPQIIKLGNFIQKHKNEYTFAKLINSPSTSIYEIGLDIPRTFPEEQDTKVLRKSLNNVLKAISIVYPKVGYCQGMNFLALRLLQIIQDEEAFWILNYLFENDENIMKNFIDPKKIEEQSYIFHQLMKTFIPKIQSKFESQSIIVQIFTVKWFMTIFSSVLGQQLFYRVFQAYLNEGWSVLYSVGIALFKIHEEKILSNNFEGNLLMINSELYQINNIDEFMEEVFRYEISREIINSHQGQYRRLQSQKSHKLQGETNRSNSMIKQRQVQNKNPVLLIPQNEQGQELHIQSKSQEITFEIFSMLDEVKLRQ